MWLVVVIDMLMVVVIAVTINHHVVTIHVVGVERDPRMEVNEFVVFFVEIVFVFVNTEIIIAWSHVFSHFQW